MGFGEILQSQLDRSIVKFAYKDEPIPQGKRKKELEEKVWFITAAIADKNKNKKITEVIYIVWEKTGDLIIFLAENGYIEKTKHSL